MGSFRKLDSKYVNDIIAIFRFEWFNTDFFVTNFETPKWVSDVIDDLENLPTTDIIRSATINEGDRECSSVIG